MSAAWLTLGALLAVRFFALQQMLHRRGDPELYRRVTMVSAAIGIAIVLGFLVAIQLRFITDHAPH